MTFFRMTETEAQKRPATKLVTDLAGVPLYMHESLMEYFTVHPLVLSARGPRIAIERDAALVELEARLLRDLVIGHHEH